MFRKTKALAHGAEASGVVLEAVYRSVGNIGLGGISDERHQGNAYRVTVRVTFDDGSAAEKSLPAKRDEIGSLYTGDIVPVRYDPTDHSKVEIDVAAMAARKAEWKAGMADYEARMGPDGYSTNPKADLIRLSIVQATRKGDASEVERLTAMLADLEQGTSGTEPA